MQGGFPLAVPEWHAPGLTRGRAACCFAFDPVYRSVARRRVTLTKLRARFSRERVPSGRRHASRSHFRCHPALGAHSGDNAIRLFAGPS
jgi:hypothetical protein